MKRIAFIMGFIALVLTACGPQSENKGQTQANSHDHGDVMVQLVTYNNDFELYVEASPLVAGGHAEVLVHITRLSDFKPLPSGNVTVSLQSGGEADTQTAEETTSMGIYSFHLHPHAAGSAKLTFKIESDEGVSSLTMDGLRVYDDEHDAIHTAEEEIISDPNAINFTKEQSWKVNFSTAEVREESFGQVIKTGAMVKSSASDRASLVARTAGIVSFSEDNIYVGTAVRSGEELFRITGSGMAGNNTHVRYMEARNNYEESKANYERMLSLAEEKIVPESELLAAKRKYETDKVVYESLKANFDGGEQIVKSSESGYVHNIYVSNGQFVEEGQVLLEVARNEMLVLMAEVEQKYAADLDHIRTAHIRLVQEDKTYTLEELNGKISSVGRSVNPDNYLIPLRFEIENASGLLPGSFVELFVITEGEEAALTIPNGALLEEQANYFVMVQLTPELFVKREVLIGASDGIKTAIRSGLHAGERVVDRGAVLVKLSQGAGALDPHAGHVH